MHVFYRDTMYFKQVLHLLTSSYDLHHKIILHCFMLLDIMKSASVHYIQHLFPADKYLSLCWKAISDEYWTSIYLFYLQTTVIFLNECINIIDIIIHSNNDNYAINIHLEEG